MTVKSRPVEFRDQTFSSDPRRNLGGLLARDIDQPARSDPMVLKCECIEKRSILHAAISVRAVRIVRNARPSILQCSRERKSPQTIDNFSPDVDQSPGKRPTKFTCETPVNAGRPCNAAGANEKSLSGASPNHGCGSSLEACDLRYDVGSQPCASRNARTKLLRLA
jgi:hypothetical protein